MLRKRAKKSMFLNVELVYVKEARKNEALSSHRGRLRKESMKKRGPSFT